jgi:hypothetical protein
MNVRKYASSSLSSLILTFVSAFPLPYAKHQKQKKGEATNELKNQRKGTLPV